MSEENSIFAEERKQKIVDYIKERKSVTVKELCDFFNMSGATIRNDLRDLAQDCLITRTHGGAIERVQMGFELDSEKRHIQNLAEKQKIAKAALELIDDGDKIILDTGTTSLELAILLRQKKDITVLTNDIVIARTLEDTSSVNIYLLGGFIKKHFHCSIGIQGKFPILVGLTADKAFMGVNGFSSEKGATTPDINQAECKKAMIAMANKVVLLCDKSKIGKVSFAQFASCNEIDAIVTNDIDKTMKEKIEDLGIEVINCGS